MRKLRMVVSTDATAVTQGAITFSVPPGVTRVAKTEDGAVIFEAPLGSIVIADPTPNKTTWEGFAINGAQRNPQVKGSQGLDARAKNYSAGAGASFPLTLQTGDVLWKVASATDANDAALDPTDDQSFRHGVIRRDGHAALFVVDDIDALSLSNLYAAPVMGWPGRAGLSFRNVDLEQAIAEITASRNLSGHGLLSYDALMDRLPAFCPAVLFGAADNFLGYEQLLPNRTGSNSTAANFGKYSAFTFQSALAFITSNANFAQRTSVAKRIFSIGLQHLDAFEGGDINYASDGGNNQWLFGAMAVAAAWSGQSALYEKLLSDFGGNFRQAIKLTSGDIATLSRHSSLSQPYPYRERNLNSISGTTATIETENAGTSGDPFWLGLGGMIMHNGTATAIVTSGNGAQAPANTTSSADVLMDDLTGFAANDTVWFEPALQPVEGDVDWTILGRTAMALYNPGAGATYRAQQTWSGTLVALKDMGIWHDSWDAPLGYARRANEADTPDASFDYPADVDTAIKSYWDSVAPLVFDFSGPAITGQTAVAGDAQITVGYSVTGAEQARVMAFPSAAVTNGELLIRGLDDNRNAASADSGILAVLSPGTQSDAVLTGLTNGQTYVVAIVARDSIGVTSVVTIGNVSPSV